MNNHDEVDHRQESTIEEKQSAQSGASAVGEEARELILAIPEDANKVELPSLLRPALELLAGLDPATAEAHVSHLIGPRFGPNSAELSAYRATLARIRREETGAEKAASGEGSARQVGSDFAARFPGLVDVVQKDDKLVFAVVVDGGHLEPWPSVRIDGNELRPPPAGQLPWHGRGIPRWERVHRVWAVKEDPVKLFRDVLDYLKPASSLPGKGYYVLLATWVFLSYLADHSQVRIIGYIYLYAVKERGKSRTLEALANVAYRPTLTETVNPAPLFRFADYLGGTLLLDTTDFWQAVVRKGRRTSSYHGLRRARQCIG